MKQIGVIAEVAKQSRALAEHDDDCRGPAVESSLVLRERVIGAGGGIGFLRRPLGVSPRCPSVTPRRKAGWEAAQPGRGEYQEVSWPTACRTWPPE